METGERAEEFRTDAAEAGERLDRALHARLSQLSRGRLQAWIREGRVRVDGEEQRRPAHRLEGGERLELRRPGEAPPPTAEEARAALPLLHVEESFAVADKPAGLLTHAAEGAREATVVEHAEAQLGPLPARDEAGVRGVVHRLDRGTSGLLLLARTPSALEELMRQFRARAVEKTYLAVVQGEPRFESDWIEAPLGRDRRRPDRVAVQPAGEGREASTFYEVRERFAGFALLACRPRTGRMHQLRVHLGSIGLPVVGDPVYRSRSRPRPPLPADAPLPARQALHAHSLAFRHPESGAAAAFRSEPPADLARLLEFLRRERRP